MINEFDDKQIYCRKLGHFLPFKYCRSEHHDVPCTKIRDCWFEKISIDAFLQDNYSKEAIAYLFKPARPKVSTLLELIERSKKVAAES